MLPCINNYQASKNGDREITVNTGMNKILPPTHQILPTTAQIGYRVIAKCASSSFNIKKKSD